MIQTVVTGEGLKVVVQGIGAANVIFDRVMDLIPYAAPILTAAILIVVVMRSFILPLVGVGVSDIARNSYTEFAKSGGKHTSGHMKLFSSNGGKFAKKGK